MADKTLIRNFVLFVIILLGCAGTLSYGLITSERDFNRTDSYVIHSHDIIFETQKLTTLVESMFASQRGYLLSGNETFLERYNTKKATISEHIANLSELIRDNPSQQIRLNEIQDYFTRLAQKLEERALNLNSKTEESEGQKDKNILSGVEEVDSLRNDIMRVNHSMLEEEYKILKSRIRRLEIQKRNYFNSLLIGVALGTTLLLIFNAFLLRAQRGRTTAETDLRTSEERFALAIEGTQDGVFDWDVLSGNIFYSGRYFEMLGYENKPKTGTTKDFDALVHPDDLKGVWETVDQYLNRQIDEFKPEFRLRHKTGKWIWIQSRAKIIFDESGKAVRMVGANTDITERVQSRQKLKDERTQAEEANRAKSDFLAHMSHEIRTPLTAISGIAEILNKKTDGFNEKQKHLIRTLTSSTASLKELINDVLDFSKIESGELTLDEHQFLLGDLFEETISMMALKANEKAISFVFDYSDLEGIEFNGDKKRIRQILVNLIGNAIKFTDKGAVTIKADIEERENKNYVRIDVTDTGIGIAPEDFDLIFERFRQADSSVSRKYGGTGLGLPISRKLALLMGGELVLSSQVGKGSTFSVFLPFKGNIIPKTQDIKETNIEKINAKLKKHVNNNTKVLIVEDYEGNVVFVSYLLDDMNLSYDVARSGKEAVQARKKNDYDVILMDVQMPEMDGFTATKEIRKLEKKGKKKSVPIIGMTAHALLGDKDKCIDAGMDYYLSKPLVEADFKIAIIKALSSKKQHNFYV